MRGSRPRRSQILRAQLPRPGVDRLAQSLLMGRFHVDGASPRRHPVQRRPFPPGPRDMPPRQSPTLPAHAHYRHELVGRIPGAARPVYTPPDGQSALLPERSSYRLADGARFWPTPTPATSSIATSNRPTFFLDMAGVVWITDFGLAKTQDAALTTTGDIVGTLHYMAPERFRGEGGTTTRRLWAGTDAVRVAGASAGVRDARSAATDRSDQEQEPARPRSLEPHIPRDLETIVLKAIQKEAQRRYQSTDELAEDLHRFLADEPIQARRTSRAGPAPPCGVAATRRWPALVLLLMLRQQPPLRRPPSICGRRWSNQRPTGWRSSASNAWPPSGRTRIWWWRWRRRPRAPPTSTGRPWTPCRRRSWMTGWPGSRPKI